ncbi:MAG: hypothetical protein WC455_27695 [Dehalococcoidia bacterium]
MPEITHDEKVEFLKHLFPKTRYSFDELADWFECSKSNIKYWVEIYGVPTLKVTGSPFILQDNLVNMFLTADRKNRDTERLVGLEFVLEDMRKSPK